MLSIQVLNRPTASASLFEVFGAAAISKLPASVSHYLDSVS